MPDKNPSRDWTLAEDKRLLTLKNDADELWTAIATKLERTKADVQNRYEDLMYEILHRRPRPLPKKIECLRCRKSFLSPNPIRQRRCDACHDKEKDERGAFDGEGLSVDYPEHPLDSDTAHKAPAPLGMPPRELHIRTEIDQFFPDDLGFDA